MNRELNVFTLRMLRDQYHAEHLDTEAEALEAAISALEQPELIEQGAYVRGFEQGRTQGMLDAKLQPTCNKLATDCISRQVAIDAAKQHWYKPDIAKALEELPSAQPEPKWIPVEERLPEKYKYVLTTYTIQPWRSKKPKRFVHIAEWMGDGWQSPIDEYLVRDEVAKIRYLAWMPLPEPWRGEES